MIDFETDPFKHGRVPKAFACGFAVADRCETFWGDESAVIKWAVKKVSNFNGIVFAHNGGKFDFPGYVFRFAGKLLHGEAVLMIGNRIVSMKLGLAEIRDSYAILPAPLKAYDKGAIDYRNFEKNRREKFRVEILNYLRRDCFSLLELVTRFLAEHGHRTLTAAGAAMRAIKDSDAKISALPENKDEFFRRWYFGGRVEVFRPGVHVGKFSIYDIKSSYPFAMMESHFSGDSVEILKSVKEILPQDFLVIKTKNLPHFPLREKTGLTYPAGEFTAYVTGWEFLAVKAIAGAKWKPKILFVCRGSVFTHFKQYVHLFYQKKIEAEERKDKAGRLIAKILINSGYGKLAQNPRKWKEYVFMATSDVIPANSEFEEIFVDDASGFSIWARPSTKPKNFINVGTAASITGFARARLIPLIYENKPYYCDTDSIIVDSDKQINVGEKLGDWSLELQGDRLLLAGKKLYGIRVLPKYAPDKKSADLAGFQWHKGRAWKIASKGCRITPEQLEKICDGNEIEHCNEAPTFSIKSPVRFIRRKIKTTC